MNPKNSTNLMKKSRKPRGPEQETCLITRYDNGLIGVNLVITGGKLAALLDAMETKASKSAVGADLYVALNREAYKNH